MRVLVTGGREFNDQEAVKYALDLFADQIGRIDLLIEGGARGADRLARAWANENGIHVATVNALWEKRGTMAGPIRNRVMIELKPDAVVAFPGGPGTKNMIDIAARERVPVYGLFDHQGGYLMRLLRSGSEWVGHELEDK